MRGPSFIWLVFTWRSEKSQFVLSQYNFVPKATNALLLNFVSTEVEIRREAFVYKGTNLLAEIGGALGLFLGVSFLSIWEILENICD